MSIKTLRIVRRGTNLTWLSLTVAAISLALLPHLLLVAGHEMFVVKGASMEPAIPLGAVILVRPVDPLTIATGDVITFRAPNGAFVSHRVMGMSNAAGLAFQTKGDGSSAADPVTVPATSVEGVVESFVPQLGYFVSALGSTAGAMSLVALLAGLMLWSWFMDELIATRTRWIHRRLAAAEPAS
ncbi:MAG: signal peptidase I [Chloroflexota bacterium]